MTIDGQGQPIRGVDGANGPQGRQGTGGVQDSDPATFRRLLEQLENVGRTGSPAEAASDDLSALQDDLRKADEEFDQVMDLRTRLEDAFRRARGE